MTEKIKCVVVEDEQHTSELMCKYISQCSQLELLGSFVSPVELLNYNRFDEVQLVFLDIQTPEMTGIDFLESISVSAEIIITTAYSEYALKGYEFRVVDYLLKPVAFPRFLSATNKAQEMIKLKQSAIAVNSNEYLMLKIDKKMVKITIKDIRYIKSDWNYLNIFTGSEKYTALGTLKKIEQTLLGFSFIRIHKSFLINLDHLKFIEGNFAVVDKEKLQISRNYKTNLFKALNIE